MVNQKNAKDNCPRCVKGKMVTDNESGEMFCSKCGFVMSEKIQESGPEWRSFTPVSYTHLTLPTILLV